MSERWIETRQRHNKKGDNRHHDDDDAPSVADPIRHTAWAESVDQLVGSSSAGTLTGIGFGAVKGLTYLATALALGAARLPGVVLAPGARGRRGRGRRLAPGRRGLRRPHPPPAARRGRPRAAGGRARPRLRGRDRRGHDVLGGVRAVAGAGGARHPLRDGVGAAARRLARPRPRRPDGLAARRARPAARGARRPRAGPRGDRAVARRRARPARRADRSRPGARRARRRRAPGRPAGPARRRPRRGDERLARRPRRADRRGRGRDPPADGPDRSRLLAGLLSRFSPVALCCVLALAVTGVVQAYVHVRHLDALPRPASAARW